jgi:hypothetical protein
VYRYDYITADYALGSMQGGVQQPIQQHSWGVTFASRKANNTIFGLQPQVSGTELGMFFPEEPELMVDGVAAVKGSYVSENKWIGGSPYERIVQDRNLLVALYRIDTGARIRHVDMFFPKTLDTIERDVAGWTICRMDSAFVAVFPLTFDGVWTEEKANWRLRMPGNAGVVQGYVVECASAADITYSTFREHYRNQSVETSVGIGIDFAMGLEALDGHRVRVSLDPSAERGGMGQATLTVNGRDVQRDDRHLFIGPFLNGDRGTGVLTMTCNGRTRVLDFTTSTVVER